MQSVNEVQVDVISDDESGQWVLGNVVVRETWTSGVECPLVTLKGTPPGDHYRHTSLLQATSKSHLNNFKLNVA